MRWLRAAFTVVGACALAAGIVLDVASGNIGHVGWLLVGPLPFYAVGVVASYRVRDNRAVLWLLAGGAMFALEVVLGDIVLRSIPISTAAAAAVSLVRQWAGLGSVLGLSGMIAFYPTGRPKSVAERRLVTIAAASAMLLPIAAALSRPYLLPGLFPDPSAPAIPSPIFVAALAPLGPSIALLYYATIGWTVVGLAVLARSYRRAPASRRRQIRWLLVGGGAAFLVAWLPLLLVAWATGRTRSHNG